MSNCAETTHFGSHVWLIKLLEFNKEFKNCNNIRCSIKYLDAVQKNETLKIS